MEVEGWVGDTNTCWLVTDIAGGGPLPKRCAILDHLFPAALWRSPLPVGPSLAAATGILVIQISMSAVSGMLY